MKLQAEAFQEEVKESQSRIQDAERELGETRRVCNDLRTALGEKQNLIESLEAALHKERQGGHNCAMLYPETQNFTMNDVFPSRDENLESTFCEENA